MFLNAILCVQKRLPKGNIWRGKYRLVRKVTGLDVASIRNELIREDRNMFYLRNPYLTAEQYEPVEKEYFNGPLQRARQRRSEKIQKFLKTEEHHKLDVFLKSSLGHNEKWE